MAPHTRDTTIAFSVDGEAFLGLVDKLGALGVRDRAGSALSRSPLVDHQLAWSVYFADPDGNPIEITTYDYAHVASHRAG
ncbi:MAG: hypothetical protein ROR55_20830 [Devosia sp.]